MDITEITAEDIERLEADVDIDALENIGRKYFRGLAAFDEGVYCGAIIWELKYVDDIYNSTESRIDYFDAKDKEAADTLLEYYTRTTTDDDIEKSFFELPGVAEGVVYEALKEGGFDVKEVEGTNVTVDVKQFAGLPLIKDKNIPARINALSALSQRTFRRGIVDFMFHIQREVPEDLDELPMEWYESDISCYDETDGDVSGYFLIHKTKSGKLRTELLADWGPESQTTLLHLIRFATIRGCESYPETTEVIIRRHDDSTYKMVKYFFPNAVGKPSIAGERNEES